MANEYSTTSSMLSTFLHNVCSMNITGLNFGFVSTVASLVEVSLGWMLNINNELTTT